MEDILTQLSPYIVAFVIGIIGFIYTKITGQKYETLNKVVEKAQETNGHFYIRCPHCGNEIDLTLCTLYTKQEDTKNGN